MIHCHDQALRDQRLQQIFSPDPCFRIIGTKSRSKLPVRPGEPETLGIAYSLEGLAQVAAASEEFERAAILWGAADHLRETIHVPLESSRKNKYTSLIAQTLSQLGDEIFDATRKKGRTMTLPETIQYALR